MTALGSLTLLGGQAHADLVFNANSIVAGVYNYNLNFSTSIDAGSGLPSQRLQATNYATIYDLGGFINASIDPAYTSLFTISTQPVGITPGGLGPTDTSLTNVTLTYTGATVTTDQSFTNILHVTSSALGVNPNGQFTSLVTQNAGVNAGTDIASIGSVAVPTVSVTPEPGSVALFVGAGLTGSAFAFRRRCRK
ncbi:MAG: sorting protein [Chthonomonadaceae bacterium]|nr:sorting protein [Chthonomonadaceae bacterium]